MENPQQKKVLVTGGNAGIGYALCKQLILEDNCYVYMGARNAERGQKAIDELPEGCKGKIELLIVDVSKEDSVKAAATTMQ
jgi:NAD(P)-dependent dehydrogenase (short-subunit alcohol dehydrogenase family)